MFQQKNKFSPVSKTTNDVLYSEKLTFWSTISNSEQDANL